MPANAGELADGAVVARFLTKAIREGRGCSLLRFGDTGGRIMARPKPDTPEWAYLQAFLGRDVTPEQVEWLARRIEEAARETDIVGLRSDLLGPPISADLLTAPDEEILDRLARIYPIRQIDLEILQPEGARRLAETRAAMEKFRFRPDAVVTNAWAHVDLAENGFFSAVLKELPSVALITSETRKPVVARLNMKMNGRLRFYECPAYPKYEDRYGGDHGFIWDRWQLLLDKVAPAWPGEPLLISAGIWTKPIAIAFRRRGGVAIDFGSVLDYFDEAATRPSVLKDRFGEKDKVPAELTLNGQMQRSETLEDFG